jgi:CubicO group peptidase (beta-lactamase class C family)
MTLRRCLGTLLLVLGGRSGVALAQDSLPPPGTIPELETRIREVLSETRTPGLGIAVVTRDSAIWVAGLGTADVAAGRPATDETLFRIGSTSKAFVSLLILQLARDGRLQLSDPIWTHAPEIESRSRWQETDPVRIVHLLEHATGWDDLAPRDYALNDSAVTLRQGLDYNPDTRISRWRPGSRVAYCNSGPAVAAYIAEKLVGRPFEEQVTARLFLPMGMTTATYFPPAPERAATLYRGDGATPYEYWHVSVRPAGAINASARDMAAYVRFLLNRGSVNGVPLLPPEDIEDMERPRSSLTARSGLPSGYGLHLATYVDSGFVWVGHSGGVNGGLTVMAYRPDQGVGYAFMINGGSGEAVRRIRRLVRDYLTRDAVPPAPPPVVALSALARSRAGWYRPDNPRVQKLYFAERIAGLVRVRAGDSTLVLRPLLDDPDEYVPVSERLFRQPFEPVATLALIDDPQNGRPAAIERMGYLLPASYRRVWTPLALAELGMTALFLLSLVATLLFALVWVPRWLFRRLAGVPRLRVRVWPLLSALAILAFIGLLLLSSRDAIARLGHPTPWALALFVTSLVFPLTAIAGVLSALQAPAAEVRRGIRLLALVTSLVFLIAALYLARWGIVGWRTWA